MSWGDSELLLISLAAMLSPTTLSFSVLALVLGDRPLRTGLWFYLGALSVMLAIGIVAAFVIGDVAATPASTPKTWVAVADVIAGALLLVAVARFVRRPADERRRLLTRDCDRRGRRHARERGRVHPARP